MSPRSTFGSSAPLGNTISHCHFECGCLEPRRSLSWFLVLTTALCLRQRSMPFAKAISVLLKMNGRQVDHLHIHTGS